MQTTTSRTSPARGASPAAINAQDAPMKGSDVLQIPLVELLAQNPAMRIVSAVTIYPTSLGYNGILAGLGPQDTCL